MKVRRAAFCRFGIHFLVILYTEGEEMTVRVVYHGGAFVPEGSCDVEEGAEGLVIVGTSDPEFAPAIDPAERRRLLSQLVADLRNNPLPPDSPRFTRDQMHERD